MFSLFLLAIPFLLPALCHGQAIRDLPGFRTNTLPRNDDGSSGPVPLGFDANFFGQTYHTLYVNNNGNVTFQGPLATYVPFGLSGANIPIIAAFFADVDTRPPGTDAVTYGSDTINGHRAFGVNYFRSGYFNMNSDRLNTFQLILIERSDTGDGNFDIEFNYRQIQWDLGDAGRGRGEIGAVVGFSNGTRQTDSLFELPGSKSLGAFVDGGPASLVTHRLNSDVPGRYIFQARSGAVKVDNAPQLEIAPFLIEPQEATLGVPIRMIAGLRFPDQRAPAAPRSLVIQARFSGQTIILHDDGQQGDEVAGDGRYSANVIFAASGDVPVTLQATGGTIDATGQGMVKVWGGFNGVANPIELDLGELKAGSQSCRDFTISAQQQGDILLAFRLLKNLPPGHTLRLRSRQRGYKPGDPPMALSPTDTRQVCLIAASRADSSEARAEPWLQLTWGAAHGAHDLAAVRLRWRVHALTFWERWGGLLGLLIALLIVLVIAYGYIKPHRFPRNLAITFVPEYEDLDTQPQPLAQWPGVGIGFYRDAHAYLHPDFRISGTPRGALASLRATSVGIRLAPVGSTLYREVELSEWEEIPEPGRVARTAVVYRVGERGPFFRISSAAQRL